MYLGSHVDKKIDNLLQKAAENMPPIEHTEWLNELINSFMANTSIVGILVLLMFLDVVTGYIAAGIAKEIDSTISYRGAMRKAQMLLMVAAGILFERVQPGLAWGKLIALLACLGEMTSILENAAKSGIPMPQLLKDTLRRLRASEAKSNEIAHTDVNIIVEDSKVARENQTRNNAANAVTENKLEILLPDGVTKEDMDRARERVDKRKQRVEDRNNNKE